MYDPLKQRTPGCNENYPDHYWATKPTTSTFEPLTQTKHCDVVVIGAGYTGLVCAQQLANKHNKSVILLEANQIAWGCSGRNAGFVLKSSGRLSLANIYHRWGKDIAKGMYAEFQSGVDLLNEFIGSDDEQYDVTRKGYLKIAHKTSLEKSLQEQALFLLNHFGDPVQFLEKEQLTKHIQADYAQSALYYPDSFALNPMKLAQGYTEAASSAGVEIHTGSPVVSIQAQNRKHEVITPHGEVHCDDVVIATNGYTPQGFHAALNNKTLPVLSSIIVSEPLSAEQLALCGMAIGLQVMDTRELKYYYRILPDRRILFGGRGAIQGKNANNPVFKARLKSALIAIFPMLSDINIDYFWSGWISVSMDDMPRIWSDNNIHYAAGYCGSGVSFTAQAGKRLAQTVARQPIPTHLPIYNSPLKTFPLPKFRRLGQWGFYQWGRLKDTW